MESNIELTYEEMRKYFYAESDEILTELLCLHFVDVREKGEPAVVTITIGAPKEEDKEEERNYGRLEAEDELGADPA